MTTRSKLFIILNSWTNCSCLVFRAQGSVSSLNLRE